ncbi:MAG: type II toxin-antitoxin system PemK/MazF family toxin [Bilifractor sp.]
MVKQGDIVVISFDPSIGHEQQKKRPALVVSSNAFLRYCGGMAALVPISHSHDFPLHISIPKGLPVDGTVLCDQVRMMDINARKYTVIGHVDDALLDEVLGILSAIFRREDPSR